MERIVIVTLMPYEVAISVIPSFTIIVITCSPVCGQAPAGAGATRIVGGAEADAGEYPWMARVDISLGSASMSCGGAIITATHVVTASHCVDSE